MPSSVVVVVSSTVFRCIMCSEWHSLNVCDNTLIALPHTKQEAHNSYNFVFNMQQSKILYALVARGRVVLAEYTSTSGNFPTVTRMLLNKIPTDLDNKMSYKYDDHVFHYMVSDEITYLCMADLSCKRRIPFGFLSDVSDRFKSTYGDQAKTAIAFAMNEDFSRVLQKQTRTQY